MSSEAINGGYSVDTKRRLFYIPQMKKRFSYDNIMGKWLT
jgi:hypothetical protein